MKKLILAIALAGSAMSLGSCANGFLTDVPTSAPLTNTIIDEQAVTLAARAVDTVALSASALVKAGVIKTGSPTALTLANALDDARRWVNAAAAARKVGNSQTYNEAMTRANEALTAVRNAISGV